MPREGTESIGSISKENSTFIIIMVQGVLAYRCLACGGFIDSDDQCYGLKDYGYYRIT